MTAHIIDRGRGPEIAGTRVTVYRVIDFLRESSSAERIAGELNLTAEQVQTALNYIAVHQQLLEAEYAQILQRVQQGNSHVVEMGRAKSPDELKQRIRTRYEQTVNHADSGR